MWGDKRPVARAIASGGGCGFAPVAPGTVASVAALLPGALLLYMAPALLPAAALCAALAGLWALRVLRIEDDPHWVVIDEIAGQFLALCGIGHATLLRLLAAFLIFRLLDVVKPGPIGWADRHGGTAGIMADDVIAGAITAGILWACELRWPTFLN